MINYQKILPYTKSLFYLIAVIGIIDGIVAALSGNFAPFNNYRLLIYYYTSLFLALAHYVLTLKIVGEFIILLYTAICLAGISAFTFLKSGFNSLADSTTPNWIIPDYHSFQSFCRGIFFLAVFSLLVIKLLLLKKNHRDSTSKVKN